MPELLSQPSFWVAGLLAVSLCGLSKGGFTGLATLSTPILSLAIPPLHAAAIMLPVLILQDVFGVWSFRREYDRAALIVLFIGCMIGTLVGALLAATVPVGVITLSLGLVALVFGAQWWAQRLLGAEERPPYRAPAPVGAFWGTLCGFTSFIAHVGGPPAQVYLMPMRLAPAVLAGTLTWLFFSLNLVKLAPYLMLGLLSRDSLIESAALAPVAVAAILVGVRLVRIVPRERFYPIIYALLVIAGLKLTYDGLRDLI